MVLGSGSKVQRLLPADAAHHIDQYTECPTYLLGCNGLIYMTKTEYHKLFGGFSTLNVEP